MAKGAEHMGPGGFIGDDSESMGSKGHIFPESIAYYMGSGGLVKLVSEPDQIKAIEEEEE